MLTHPQTINPDRLGTLDLSFVGDGVYELLVREHLAGRGAMPVSKMHTMAVAYVRAGAQSQAVEVLLPLLTEREEAVYRRGRNANGVRIPKNGDMTAYRRATGLEALFGWLYLSGEQNRLRELFAAIVSAAENGGTADE